MKNTIKLTIPFSFRGVEHTPSSVVDLDEFIQGDQDLQAVAFHVVANENKIDNYSYEYEVLESSPKIFSDPTGAACHFLSDNCFDLEGFKQHQNKAQAFNTLHDIAKNILNVDNLEEHEALKQALLAAYEAGQDTI